MQAVRADRAWRTRSNVSSGRELRACGYTDTNSGFYVVKLTNGVASLLR